MMTFPLAEPKHDLSRSRSVSAVALSLAGVEREPLKTIGPERQFLIKLAHRWRAAVKAGQPFSAKPVHSRPAATGSGNPLDWGAGDRR